jgi:hypothetical protein
MAAMWKQRMMWVVWPSFLMAGVLEMLVFGLVDPGDLQWYGSPMTVSRQAFYTIAFFAFLSITSISSGLTALLAMPAVEVNHEEPPVPGK